VDFVFANGFNPFVLQISQWHCGMYANELGAIPISNPGKRLLAIPPYPPVCLTSPARLVTAMEGASLGLQEDTLSTLRKLQDNRPVHGI
jgi:hypothetical protein